MNSPRWDRTLAGAINRWPKLRVVAFEDSVLLWLPGHLGWRAGGLTLWNTVYLHRDRIGTDDGASTLRHELVHVADQHRWHILFFLSYLFVLPIGPSFKAYWEWRAYQVNLLDEQLRMGSVDDKFRDWVDRQFTTIRTLWSWPFGMRKRIDRFVERIKAVPL